MGFQWILLNSNAVGSSQVNCVATTEEGEVGVSDCGQSVLDSVKAADSDSAKVEDRPFLLVSNRKCGLGYVYQRDSERYASKQTNVSLLDDA